MPVVPGPADANNDRITSRPADSDFARMPDEEVVDSSVPGSGQHGTVSDGPVLPKVVVGIGFAVALSTFLFQSGWPLGIGLLLIVVGAIWTAIREPSPGSGHGTGPVQID